MLSPAQPSPALSGKKMHHFELLFSSKIFKEREIILFKNRKNEIIFGPKIFRERIKNARFVFIFFSIIFHAFLQSEVVIQIPKAILSPWLHLPFLMKIHDFSMKFDVFSMKID